jgi:peptidoglycan/LPS O-acetylase OafA/YrhL
MLQKFTGPGIFRLFLALLVFVHHTTRFSVGTSAVYIFFCLSGYWIYRMYVGRYSATRQPYLTYAVSRIWRLLPVFWLVTLLTLLYLYLNGSLIAYWNGSSHVHLILSSIFIFGYHTLDTQVIVPAWSLDVEMQFYVIAPFIAILLARRKAQAGWILLAVAAVSLASFLLSNPVLLMDDIVYFSIGMAAASLNWRPSGKLALLSFAGTALLVACCAASPWRGVILVGTHPGPLAIYTEYANVAIALLMAPYAIFTTGQKGFAADGMFADLSYIVYLLHWAGSMWLAAHPGNVIYRLTHMLIAWIAVIGASYLIWRFFDHPINRLRSQWVSKRKKTAAAPVRLTDTAPAKAAT